MFSAVPMCQLRIMVLARDRRTVLQGLGDMGLMHLQHEDRDASDSDTPLLPPADYTAALLHCDDLLRRSSALRQSLALPAGATTTHASHAPRSMESIEELFKETEEALNSLTERAAQNDEARNKLSVVIEQLHSFREVDLPFEELENFSFLHFAIGSLPLDQLNYLRDTVAPNVVLLTFPRNAESHAVVAATSRTGRFALETALQQAEFRREPLPVTREAPLNLLLKESEQEEERLAGIGREIELAHLGLAGKAEAELAAAEAWLQTERRLLEAEAGLPRTELTVMITGWIPQEDHDRVVARVREMTHNRCVIETLSADELPTAEIPILLRQSRLLRPFAMLVKGYGLPGYRDVEPTLFVAITYMLMFGMMFGDVGHGGVLALVGLGAIWRGRNRKTRDIGTLLAMAGVASLLFGFVYGSFFGLSQFHKYALWRDPLEGSPLQLMLVAITLGVGVISVGVILNIVNRFRHGDWLGGFLDSYGVAGAIFYWGILGLLLKYTSLQERGLVGIVTILVVVLPLIAWALRAPLRHALARRSGADSGNDGGYFSAIMESVVEAFEAALSYMANTISFVRLAAYAMSHAAVLMATFVMAREVEKVSVGGGLLAILVIIGGNLIAIVLEGIIAAVQALRLEYYEFFNKFFSGSGREYKPFALNPGEEGE